MNTSIKQVSRFVLAGVLMLGGIAGCQQEIISSAPSSRARGVKEYNDGNYADAAAAFRSALRSDPRDYKSQYYLAQSYEQLTQYQQAIQAYKASLDAQDRTLSGREDNTQRLATIDALASCISKSDNRDAELDAVERQAKSSGKPQDFLLVAKIYQNRGDADGALDALNRGVLADPKNFPVVKEYGLYLEQLGQRQKAVYQLRKAYSLNATDQQVNDALRRLNIVPGPGLKDESALVKPPIPEGPLPELSDIRFGGQPASAQQQPTAQQVPPPAPTDAAPPAPRPDAAGPRD